MYFVTFRLADSLPVPKLRQWVLEREQWLLLHPAPWDDAVHDDYMRRFPAQFERWLDEGYGSCVLARSECREVVAEALQHGHGGDYCLDQWVVLPNHVHVLVTPIQRSLSAIIQRWKSFSALRINRSLGRRGALWQKESFDHIVRNGERLERFRRYIENNPRRVGLSA